MRMTNPRSSTFEVVQPTGWPRPSGYSNGIRVPAGHDLLFVAGQVAWDAENRIVSDGFAEQFEQALLNCVAVVEAAGGRSHHIVRLTVFCRDKEAYLARLSDIGKRYRAAMGNHYPVMSLIEISGLVEDGVNPY